MIFDFRFELDLIKLELIIKGYWSYGNPALTCAGADSCQHNGDTQVTQDLDGAGKGCRYTLPQTQGIWPWYDAKVTFCCQASALNRVRSLVLGAYLLADRLDYSRALSTFPCPLRKFGYFDRDIS